MSIAALHNSPNIGNYGIATSVSCLCCFSSAPLDQVMEVAATVVVAMAVQAMAAATVAMVEVPHVEQ